MKFRFKNIGPIKEAELELGDLTIIAGYNNTGKTYLVYTLYGFLQKFSSLFRQVVLSERLDLQLLEGVSYSIDNTVYDLIEGNRVSWKVDKNYLDRARDLLMREICRSYSEDELHLVFNVSKEYFKEASFEIDLDYDWSGNFKGGYFVRRDSTLLLEYDGERLNFFFESEFSEEEPSLEPSDLYTAVMFSYSRFLLGKFLRSDLRPFLLSSARHSIPLFYKEIDYARNQFVREWQQKADNTEEESRELQRQAKSRVNEPFAVSDMNDWTNRFALPIHDNIDFTRSIPETADEENDSLEDNALSELKRMVGGFFERRNDRFHFVSNPDNAREFNIPLHLASSSAFEMSLLYFHLDASNARGRSRTNRLLIIDEPESHLDTANQVKFARLLARLVNSGGRVLITTHSDYIIREVNNLIMLSSPLEDGDQAKVKLGYQEYEELTLDQVQAYVAKNGTLDICKKDKFGVEISVFDETIDELNQTSEELASQIMMRARGE